MDVIASVTLCFINEHGAGYGSFFALAESGYSLSPGNCSLRRSENNVNSTSVCCMIAQLIVFLHRKYRLTPSIPPKGSKIGIDNITIGECIFPSNYLIK